MISGVAGQWEEAAVREYLHDCYGLDATHLRTSWLKPLLAALSRSGAAEEDVESAIVSAATVHESMFLRHAEHFEWLAQTWLPELVDRRRTGFGGQTIRVLSAACACGEEPYSLAAVLLPLLPLGWQLEIEAVDACDASLVAAEKGQYSRWALRGVPVEAQRDWLLVDGNRVTVADGVRKPVRFRRHNLLAPLPSEWTFDLIVCRNMLIYFHPDAVRRTFGHLFAALRPHGVLLPGPSDPRPPQDLHLESGWTAGVAWYRRESGRFRVAEVARPSAVVPVASAMARASVARTQTPATRPRSRGLPPSVRHLPASESAIHRSASGGDPQYDLACELARQGESALALQVLQQLLCYAPLHVPALLLSAMIAGEAGQRDLAVEQARKAAYLQPESPYPVFLLGDALHRQGQELQARSRYQWARELLADWADDHALPYSDQLTKRQLKELLDARPT